MRTKPKTTNATLWLGNADDPLNAPAILENEETFMVSERSDVDEVAIHATMPGDDNPLVSLYMTRAEAALLAVSLAQRASI